MWLYQRDFRVSLENVNKNNGEKIGASKVTILPINTQFIFFAFDKSGEHSECSSCFLVLWMTKSRFCQY